MSSQSLFSTITAHYTKATGLLESLADYFPNLLIRIILAWEFGEAGFEKLRGTNWFTEISFPFPFSLLPAEISWNMAIFFEIVGAFALLFGFATRFFSISLLILTVVAIAAVHWPEQWGTISELLKGYRIIDENGDGFGNYKLPVIFIIMFLPLIFSGAGKLSLDYLVKKYLAK
ncbi:MAG TPA: DoxX family protein [Methylotenera sp.]|nr:DoxX family protein [Methylotenera sp.]